MDTVSTRPTLAQRLGQTRHLSPLLRRIEVLAGVRDDLPVCLLQSAVRKGAGHFQNSFTAPFGYPEKLDQLRNEELGIALCLNKIVYDPLHIRVASELLSAPGNSPERIIHLARQERCELIVRHIAQCGKRVEPENPLWIKILSELRCRDLRDTVFLPGWTRFVSMTGFTRSGGKHIEWLRIHGRKH